MKKKASAKTSQKTYYEEIIVKPAKRLLKALQEAQALHTTTKAKTRKTATSR